MWWCVNLACKIAMHSWALVWVLLLLVDSRILASNRVLFEAACWRWHQNLGRVGRVVRVHALGFIDHLPKLTSVVTAFDSHLFFGPQNLFQRVLFLHHLPIFSRILLHWRVLGWGWVFRLDTAGRNALFMTRSWRIALRSIFCWYVAGVAGFCVSDDAVIVVDHLWCFFAKVLWDWSFNFLLFVGNSLFFLVLLAIKVLLFNDLSGLLRSGNAGSLNTLFYLIYWFCLNIIWVDKFLNIFFCWVQLFDSFVNEFSVLFQVQLCVVANWRLDHFVWHCLLFRFVEWG